MEQVHRLLAFFAVVPLDGEQELDQDFLVLLLTVSIPPEKRFLFLFQLKEVRVGHEFINFRLL